MLLQRCFCFIHVGSQAKLREPQTGVGEWTPLPYRCNKWVTVLLFSLPEFQISCWMDGSPELGHLWSEPRLLALRLETEEEAERWWKELKKAAHRAKGFKERQ